MKAPSDGTPVGVSLRPGQRVASLPMRGWIAFVSDEKPRVAVGIPQYAARHVRPGQSAEVIFKAFPGRTFSAKVESVADMTTTGQVEAEGVVPHAPDPSVAALPFGAVLALDETPGSEPIPGGAVGSAAIYTDHATSTHVIRKVMLRQESWMNYVLP